MPVVGVKAAVLVIVLTTHWEMKQSVLALMPAELAAALVLPRTVQPMSVQPLLVEMPEAPPLSSAEQLRRVDARKAMKPLPVLPAAVQLCRMAASEALNPTPALLADEQLSSAELTPTTTTGPRG
jgi:hypothetical protein